MFNTGGQLRCSTSADVGKYSMANHRLDIARWWPMFTMNIHTAPNFGEAASEKVPCEYLLQMGHDMTVTTALQLYRAVVPSCTV